MIELREGDIQFIDKIRATERELDIFKRREAGETLRSIGASYGLSHERARQLHARVRWRIWLKAREPEIAARIAARAAGANDE